MEEGRGSLYWGAQPNHKKALVVGLKGIAHSSLQKQKPTECLLGACSGQHSVGYRFSLLTLLFSGVCRKIKHPRAKEFRLFL